MATYKKRIDCSACRGTGLNNYGQNCHSCGGSGDSFKEEPLLGFFAKTFVSHGRQLLVYAEVAEAGEIVVLHQIASLPNFFGEMKQTYAVAPDAPEGRAQEFASEQLEKFGQEQADAAMAQFVSIDARMGGDADGQ